MAANHLTLGQPHPQDGWRRSNYVYKVGMIMYLLPSSTAQRCPAVVADLVSKQYQLARYLTACADDYAELRHYSLFKCERFTF